MIVLEKKVRKVECRQRIIEHKRIKVEVTGVENGRKKQRKDGEEDWEGDEETEECRREKERRKGLPWKKEGHFLRENVSLGYTTD